jgi:hypothetical protein
MGTLSSWKEADLRQLAEQFRQCASETRLPKYIALLNQAADELELQADQISESGSTDPKSSQYANIHI